MSLPGYKFDNFRELGDGMNKYIRSKNILKNYLPPNFRFITNLDYLFVNEGVASQVCQAKCFINKIVLQETFPADFFFMMCYD